MAQRRDAIGAERKGHGRAGAEWGGAHDDGDDVENDARSLFDQVAYAGRTVAQPHQGKAAQHGDDQGLQHVAIDQARQEARRDKPHQEATERLGLTGILGDRGGIAVQVEAGARMQQVAGGQAQDQGDARQHFEIDNGLQADAADLAGLADMTDARNHRAEDQHGDHHLQEIDEGVADRLHPRLGADLRPDQADGAADQDAGHDLHVEIGIDRFFHTSSVGGAIVMSRSLSPAMLTVKRSPATTGPTPSGVPV